MQRTSLTEAEVDASESSLFQFQRKVQQASPMQAKVFDAQLEDRFSEDFDSRERVNRDEGKKRSPGTYRPLASGIRSEVGIDSTLSEGAEVDPFAVRTVGSDWIIFERKVWWQNRRYVQGFVARLDRFVEAVLLPQLENPALPGTSSYLLFHRGELISPQAVDSAAPKPDLLYSADLRYPFSDFHLALTVEKLPDGPGHQTVNWLVWVLSILFFGGLFGIYRLTATQIELSQKKSDFVSAVSHELKSPLTAIRMYGEILMEGWVEEERREGYYRHIRDESERLSRLIQNVLTLAQLEKSEWKSNLSVVDPVQFVTEVVQKLRTQVQRAGFEIDIARKGKPLPVQVDRDALVQILINLIDNAIKFGGEAEKKIVLTVDRIGDETWIRVRDFGSGIPAREMKKIFEKFYRVEDELTRTARGTGIGLSLVKMLAKSMDAEVDVRNCNPGAEFSIHLKARPVYL
jgi:signal transduction histidine kinase